MWILPSSAPRTRSVFKPDQDQKNVYELKGGLKNRIKILKHLSCHWLLIACRLLKTGANTFDPDGPDLNPNGLTFG